MERVFRRSMGEGKLFNYRWIHQLADWWSQVAVNTYTSEIHIDLTTSSLDLTFRRSLSESDSLQHIWWPLYSNKTIEKLLDIWVWWLGCKASNWHSTANTVSVCACLPRGVWWLVAFDWMGNTCSGFCSWDPRQAVTCDMKLTDTYLGVIPESRCLY